MGRAQELAGAPDLKIFLGQGESVRGSVERLQALHGVLGDVVGVDQEAVALVGAAPDAPAQLMQGGKSEALGVLHHHDGCVGNVDANLDDGRRNKDSGRSRNEAFHYLPLLVFLEF